MAILTGALSEFSHFLFLMVLLKGSLTTQVRVFVLDTLLSTVFKDSFVCVCGTEFSGVEVTGARTHWESCKH